MKKSKTNKSWTLELCKQDALKYKTRTEWSQNSTGYNAACNKNWLNECCIHMLSKQKPNRFWTLETCKQDALKYTTQKEWRKNSGGAVSAAQKNGWMDECCVHMVKTRKLDGFWTLEACKEDALKYKTKDDWRDNSSGAFSIAHKRGWFKECCAHMTSNRVSYNFWTKEECVKNALKFSTKTEWKKSKNSSYSKALKNGWMEECSAHMDILALKRTIEECKEDALKYKTRNEWKKQSHNTYQAAQKNGWLEDCCSHMVEISKPKNYWTLETCKEDALKYKTRTEWSQNSSGYNVASINNWLNECCAHMDIKMFSKIIKLDLIAALSNSDLLTMDPVELSIIIQQGKLPIDFRVLVNTGAESDERIATLRELQERYESEEEVAETPTEESINNDVTAIEPELVENDEVDAEITNAPAPIEREPRLPLVNQIQDLHSLDNSIYAGMDEEAFQTLIQYKLRKIWNSMLNKEVDIDKLSSEIGGKYFTMIKEEFLREYEAVLLVEPNVGYNFRDRSGNIAQPNLMQKLTVYRLLKNKYYGNWSGTGAGKTLSFILASRNMDARLTLVIALNSTIEQTCKSIKSVYPDSKCFTEYKEDYVFDRSNHNYLVLNYEKFQQDKSEALFQSLTNNNQIDFIVIDEVHNAKQREEDNESARRIVMTRLLGRARENKNLHVLAMSATPVINNLFEAKSLLQLMSGFEYEDLQTRRTIGNALSIFQQLTLNGLRFIPKYDINVSELTGRNMSNLNIDGSHLLDALLKLTPNDYIGVEKLILSDKLQAITPYLRKGTIIYSYFTTGIINKIQKHVESFGFKVGTYTGEESTTLRTQNLKDFISGKIDILIGSRPIGTGVDGLQDVCNRMICITLPWTDSEYTQLKGRIYRQGSEFDGVEIIIPQVRIELEDEVWSWDIQRLNLIKNKKTLADAAVDGVIPSNAIPTPETMLRRSIESLKNWQDRVSSGNVISSNRKTLQINLYPEVDDEQERLRRINSELSEFNRRGKTTRSETMHKEFTDNPDSWHRYHTLRKSRMESWEEIPYEYIATKIMDRNDVVADFGCGENLFRKCIPNNKVYAFDHIAIDETVIACDMKNTGLDNEIIDVAVFSLAMWGTNNKEYIKEAYRVLRRKGMIYIAEPSKDYDTTEEQQVLIDMIKEQGFQQVGVIENRGKFIYLTGIKI